MKKTTFTCDPLQPKAMKKSEKYQLLCLGFSVAHIIMLAVTQDNAYFTSSSIFAAAVFIIGALDK
jgi:hypothetical protein